MSRDVILTLAVIEDEQLICIKYDTYSRKSITSCPSLLVLVGNSRYCQLLNNRSLCSKIRVVEFERMNADNIMVGMCILPKRRLCFCGDPDHVLFLWSEAGLDCRSWMAWILLDMPCPSNQSSKDSPQSFLILQCRVCTFDIVSGSSNNNTGYWPADYTCVSSKETPNMP